MDYTEMSCEACRVGAPPATDSERKAFLEQSPGWQRLVIDDEPRLRRVYSFGHFVPALAFTNSIGEIAEAEAHQPALLTEWGRVTVDWWTHKIGDIHLNDLILAARSDVVYTARA
ncbi:MAG TPA: 4a-hydroxytetrahydrobiopterin dehydratase [Gammaproteobacteria bacterium]|jgi:4a-hydroxytetrahydrobiopterin dehydratase|nr:4a-hydroxytetrahydrobiopterin dehydratase [Arenicellales bacterium]MDP6792159.1 4a-hydroxytetrahydrobiopterin dehydratase [Arenicellales bacterium]MDP6919697.1 4a-hydroxytetrahydrobiopterin dehydratase [Arenicellales bacterium]HCX88039.1 4a-hydroxytetrahydrobiopterin dehydratase [Gammaproteobacteria bacterium]|tara:strand:+ start:2150 stop:2494 length:345 start_codon:yes stop_codon:yes gene_type:complete